MTDADYEAMEKRFYLCVVLIYFLIVCFKLINTTL